VSLGTSHTSPAVRIADVAVLQGLNVHAPVPVVRLVLDTSSGTLAAGSAFAESLLECLPGLGDEGLAGAPLADVVARVATHLQVAAGADLPGTPLADPDGGAVYAYDDPSVGVAAGELAVRIVEALLVGEPAGVADEVATFVAEAGHRQLSSTDAAIVRGARERGIPVVRIRGRLVQLGQGCFQQRMWGSHTSHTTHLGSKIAKNKQYAHRLLSALGLPVALQEWADTPERAVTAAERIGYPVVVKPNQGNMGQGVTVGLDDAAEVRAAFDLAAPGGVPLVQNHVPGADHRMLVINGELVGVVKRIPAQVVGDGTSSIEDLVEVANRDPRRGPGHSRALTLLALDDRADRVLARRGLDRRSVPGAGQPVDLSDVANVSLGGMPVDVTDEVHPDNRTMAVRAALAIGLDIAGVDFLTTDISRSYVDTGGAICEINDKPDLRLHLFPAEGRPRDVVGPILDMLFPPGAPARIPVAVVAGERGKHATSRLLAGMLRAAGHRVGLAGAEGVELDGRTVRKGPLSPPTAARTLLLDPTVDRARGLAWPGPQPWPRPGRLRGWGGAHRAQLPGRVAAAGARHRCGDGARRARRRRSGVPGARRRGAVPGLPRHDRRRQPRARRARRRRRRRRATPRQRPDHPARRRRLRRQVRPSSDALGGFRGRPRPRARRGRAPHRPGTARLRQPCRTLWSQRVTAPLARSRTAGMPSASCMATPTTISAPEGSPGSSPESRRPASPAAGGSSISHQRHGGSPPK
jgi:cyanophycin synthetase